MLPIIGLVFGVLIVNAIATRLSLPPPILLVVAGLGVSFVPGVPPLDVTPDVVLAVFDPVPQHVDDATFADLALQPCQKLLARRAIVIEIERGHHERLSCGDESALLD